MTTMNTKRKEKDPLFAEVKLTGIGREVIQNL